jgi:transcription elongation factor Elf1
MLLANGRLANAAPQSLRLQMRGHPMPKEFTCPSCGSQSVVYPQSPDDDASVVCRTCGTYLGTLSQFRRLLQSPGAGTCLSGC